jgi:hypothetical protein
MKHLSHILILTLILVSFRESLAQNDSVFLQYMKYQEDSLYTIDTLHRNSDGFGPNTLFETDWLINTGNQFQCRGVGFWPSTIEVSECEIDGDRASNLKGELVNLIVTDSLITSKWLIGANCCQSFACDMELVNDSTLNLSYISYGTHCACTCGFYLTYNIVVDWLDEDYKERFMKLKFITLNGRTKNKFELGNTK